MGCCLSTATTTKPSPRNHHPHPLPESETFQPKTPPHPPHEEETVKEVLSETHITKPIETITQNSFEPKEEEEPEPINPPLELSESSELVSEVYENVSIDDKKEDEVMSEQCGQFIKKSPARKRPNSGEIACGKERRVRSPMKTSKPTSEKETQIVKRPVRGRESGHVTAIRRQVGPDRFRLDPGEISGRRSRSPVISRQGKATPNVAARDRTLKVTGLAAGDRRTSSAEKSSEVKPGGDSGLTVANESLENPLVSLECFIFL